MNTGRWTTVVTTAVLVVAVAALVVWLRSTAPASSVDPSVTSLLPTDDPLRCDELADDVAEAGAAPVGRALSGEVLTCPFEFDGLLVTYVGEVVGDILARDGGSWLLVNDDTYALEDGPLSSGGTPRGTNSGLTVWLPDPLDELVDEPGRAEVRGDVVVVTGRIHRTDPTDGGGLTIRAEDAEVLAEAVTVQAPVHWRQVGAAGLLAVLAVGMLSREREQRDW